MQGPGLGNKNLASHGFCEFKAIKRKRNAVKQESGD